MAVASLAAGCTAPQPEPKSLVIGVLASTTGAGSAIGEDAVRGAELAVFVINESHPQLGLPLAPGNGLPGLGGARLTLVTGDTEAKAEVAAARSAAMISDGHSAGVVIADTAEVTAATGSQMQRLRVPLIDALSTADYLPELGMDWYFRTGPGDATLAQTSYALLRGRPGRSAPRLAVISETAPAGAAVHGQLTHVAGRLGGRVVLDHQLTGSSSAEQTLRDRLDAHSSDAVLAWAHTGRAADAIVKAAGRAPGSPSVIGFGPGFSLLGRAPSGTDVLRAVPWSAELAQRSPTAQAVMKLYEDRYGRPMTETAASAFTAVLTMAVAADTARSTDPTAIRSALRQISLPATQLIMPWNGVRFGSDGSNQLAGAVVEEWDAAAFRVVYPAELAVEPALWNRAGSAA